MTGIFRSCLSRFYSNTNQSISNEYLLNKTNSIILFNENSMDYSSIISNQNNIKSKIINSSPSQLNSFSSNKQIFKQKQSHFKNKKRGPCYSRINEKSQSLLTRLINTIFGDYENKKQRITHIKKKSILPTKLKIKKQFEKNQQTLRSLVTLLTQIESNVKLTTTTQTPTEIISNENQNNNRIDDTSSSYSNDNYQHSSTSKPSINTRSTKKRKSEENTLSSSSINSHYSIQSPLIIRQKMIDNQQQTQIYPTKINIGTSTQFNHINDIEPSWFDIIREDQTTINAWARIRRRLKPNQQKDILRALMIICANLFEIPIENKHI